MKKTPSYFDVWMTSDAVLFPVSRSDMPAPFLTPNLLCWLGRRKSRSITRTFLPIRLRAMAVAKAQEDLPSPCLALLKIRLRGRPWDDTSMSDERSDEQVRSEEHTSELQSIMRIS